MTGLVGRLLDGISKSRKRIVVIGDAMVDRWVHGHVAQCQDGCPKFVQESVVETSGGAANAEQCLSHWEVNTSLYAQSVRPTKCRYIDDGKMVFRSDDDAILLVAGTCSACKWAREIGLEMAERAGAVLLSDYDKGMLTSNYVASVAGLCRDRGIPCVADCKRAPRVYAGCILKGNLEWARKYMDGVFDRVANIVITRGDGNPLVEGETVGNTLWVNCVNHVGAGDCFAAHLALALAYGFSLRDAAVVAHSAGRVYVQHPHNRAPYPSEVAADMSGAFSAV